MQRCTSTEGLASRVGWRRTPVRWAVAVLLFLGLLSSSCSHLGYYSQSLWGGARILVKRRPIDRVVDSAETPGGLRARLELVLEILDFARQELGLPDNGSYRSFVPLDRDYVVWNVVAAPRYSVVPRHWCFPIAGCVSYRGYFSRRRAERFAAKLSARGWDVAVSGVTAYSTLGWFEDPVLSTFLRLPDADLAALLFHELAHQKVYVKGDTPFNESFATAVEEEGLRRWLEARGEAAQMASWRAARERQRRFSELVLEIRDELAKAYAEAPGDSERSGRKAGLFAELRARYGQLRASWGGNSDYDAWFERDLNNAHLATVGAYWEEVPAFGRLLCDCAGDLSCFYAVVEEIAAEPAAERTRRLAELAL